jgi:hypothetical protein
VKPHLLLATTLVALTTGCQKGAFYAVHPVHYETISGRLDAEWFERDIIGKGGTRQALELIYCPMVPSGPLVCRTAVVWEKDKTELLESK